MAHLPILGEPLAIELANTVVVAEDCQLDLLQSPGDVEAWIRAHRDELPERALEDPPSLKALRRLRDAVRELLHAALEERAPAAEALRCVNAASAEFAPRPLLEWHDNGPPRTVDAMAPERASRATLGIVGRSAVEILGGPDRGRLRRCEGPGCVLLFVATNPRRRWCSPATCGNRVRVARHYARHHRPGGA